jgi:hypothetical protein
LEHPLPLNITKPEPYIVTIDGESIRLHFRRMTVTEFETFEAFFTSYGKGRRPGETAPAPDEGWQALAQRAADYNVANAAWILDAFERYVTVEPGDLTFEGEVVTSGARFVELFIGQTKMLIGVLGDLYLENKLTAQQKKTLQSLLASEAGSTSETASANGARPETTATNVESETSAASAVATAPSNDAGSGTPDPCA